MNKNKFKILIITIIALLLAVLSVYLLKVKLKNNNTQGLNNTNKVEIISESEKNYLGLYHLGVYQVISRDANGKITSYKLVYLKDEQPVALSFMTDTEKEKIIPSSSPELFSKTKIQVLKRDDQGKVIAYKIIKKDSDIVTKY
jgi:hypothetical protein